MVERRWLIGLGPPVAAALAVGLLATSSVGAADRAWEPPPCPGGPERLAAAADAAPLLVSGRPVPDAWYTLDPTLDESGSLAGQRLRIGVGSQRAAYVELPAESAASGPFGRLVLVVADDGHRSEVRAIDRRGGCAWRVGGSDDVIRRATLDPAGTAVYEFRVDRASRADLGVWRRPLDGSPVRLVLPAPADDERFGRTWSTSLGWTAAGDALVVQSCGEAACRTRIVDPVTRAVRHLDAPGSGALLGVVDDETVGYAACDAFPCPVVAAGASGEARTLTHASGAGVLTKLGDSAVAVVETPTGAELRGLDGNLVRTIARPHRDAHLASGLPGTNAGQGLPDGWIAWAPDGRSPVDATLTRLSDGRSFRLTEVAP